MESSSATIGIPMTKEERVWAAIKSMSVRTDNILLKELPLRKKDISDILPQELPLIKIEVKKTLRRQIPPGER
jgi:hypothetical protein